jgi:hypothetical protein
MLGGIFNKIHYGKLSRSSFAFGTGRLQWSRQGTVSRD